MGQRSGKHGAAMKGRPIIMGAESVTAILNEFKTHTRRVIKPQPDAGMRWETVVLNGYGGWTDGHGTPRPCPYGQVGDRLWVREAMYENDEGIWCYTANDEWVGVNREDETRMMSWVLHKENSTCSSIHMPRWASRLTLEIVSINAERLQDITNEGVTAEGIVFGCDSRDHFADYWDTINAARGFTWASNPWVWDIGFKKVTA